ncbi:hypothetical protein MPH_03922 [Macrophomina phaseolina MS6]|uniref:Uncharacterized protein n=1 Tax=Macrophomina phaseolina (strain MS6) TaxID=1126212 RepID=K2R8P5_MACPH|nr:hypothetical protein MPH_03922 [Macrophomina phaseolina MS6]
MACRRCNNERVSRRLFPLSDQSAMAPLEERTCAGDGSWGLPHGSCGCGMSARDVWMVVGPVLGANTVLLVLRTMRWGREVGIGRCKFRLNALRDGPRVSFVGISVDGIGPRFLELFFDVVGRR